MGPLPLLAAASGLTYIGLRTQRAAKRPLYLAM